MAADDHETRGRLRPVAGRHEGLDEQREPLYRGEAADGEYHHAVDEWREVLAPVPHAAGVLARKPAARYVDERLSKERCAIDVAADEDSRVEPVGEHDQPIWVNAEQPLGTRALRSGQHDEPVARVRPAAHPRGPRGGVCPARRRTVSDCLDSRSSVPCR